MTERIDWGKQHREFIENYEKEVLMTPVGAICLEPRTDQCICHRLECGGVRQVDEKCPEHNDLISHIFSIHSHSLRFPGRTVRTPSRR